MITGKTKSQIDAIWKSFWTGGITNSIDVLEQMTYLFFMKMLDDFCAGCCYGIEYNGPLSIAGHFPVQLFESGLLFAFSFVILGLICKRSRNEFGMTEAVIPLFIWYILYYSFIRFFLEFLRADEIRGQISFGNSITLSISQVVSVILFIGAVTLLIILLIKNHKTDKLKQTEIQHD